ncbi:MAG: toll/interleukin-1 receptor domain-containing protein [Saprospiraceae bacterium]|nr:toll/interleukin-1 receptor domain-containing protein [Saprospiraceae bacterium]
MIYVDWGDPEMPQFTSASTAALIKKRIKDCNKFVVLFSTNAKDSKWVPWELGFADGIKPLSDIAILPIIRGNDNFNGVEYMDLYPKIAFDGIGSNRRTVIEKDFFKDMPRSVKSDWLEKSIVIF